ncbi:MAG: T9SS type A sorting domain-containing protein [Flavobacteriales bacterium]|nr:T9SS type A sorting domain-containing protein [Flavobacteriales bacterium]
MKQLLSAWIVLIPFLGFTQTELELVGYATANAPWFAYHQSHHAAEPIAIGIDPQQWPVDGSSAQVYITADQSAEEWALDGTLTDVRGSAQSVLFSGVDITDMTFILDNTSALESTTGIRPGRAYDVVLDMNANGMLDSGDYIDGLNSSGFYVLGNLFNDGPYDVDTAYYSSSFWHTFRVYYPANISELEAQPLVVISHGWTHNYWYYDYLGYHLASYGYVVMSHRNDVGNGGAAATETASQTALENIDEFWGHLDTIADGALVDKVNKSLIVHTGHSTGGECVVRAYKRLYDGDYESPFITHENIVLVSSLAPVAFLSAEDTHPEGCNYHQFLCGADTDVSGNAYDGYVQPFSIYERGYGNKQVTYIHGAGHEDLHDEPGNPLASGPDLIGKEATHTIVKPYFLALCELYTRNNLAMKEYFTRNRNAFRPINISDTLNISGEYRDAEDQNIVVDHFETFPDEHISSSEASVNWDFDEYHEILMQDIDESFEWTGDNWANGLTRARFDDHPHAVAFEWDQESTLEFGISPEIDDWSNQDYLSFRCAQITRHPFNMEQEGLSFRISVEDAMEHTASVHSANYGLVQPPYPRGGGGYMTLCLDSGTYTIELAGSNWESEMSFSIPGYIENAGAGTYELVIGAGDPCTEIEVLMYDSWGDGWDSGTIQFFDSTSALIAEGTMNDGSVPDIGEGWQNEFYIFRIPLSDFQLSNPDLNWNAMLDLKFEFGIDGYSPQGAMVLDNIELTHAGLSFVASVPDYAAPYSFALYPNPNRGDFRIVPEGYGVWNVQIYDMSGRVVCAQQAIAGSWTYTGPELQSGLYIVQVTEKGKMSAVRMVVE